MDKEQMQVDLQARIAAIEHHAGKVSNDDERAFAKIQRLACVREQASEALYRRLVREGFDEHVAREAVERAVRCGLVDDQRYAESLVRSRRAAGRGNRGIAAELEDLGIDSAQAFEAAEADVDAEEGELNRALDVLRRKPPRAKNVRDAAYRRLMQKGYGSSIASTAARLWSEGCID